MKKFGVIALTLALLLSLCACRRNEDTNPTQTTPGVTTSPTRPSTRPMTEPTFETNIPDPTVNQNSTMDTTATTDATTGNGDSTPDARGRLPMKPE